MNNQCFRYSWLRTGKNRYGYPLEDEYVDFYYERNLPEMLITRRSGHSWKGRCKWRWIRGHLHWEVAKDSPHSCMTRARLVIQKKSNPFLNSSQILKMWLYHVLMRTATATWIFCRVRGQQVPVTGSRESQHRFLKMTGTAISRLDLEVHFPNNDMNISVAVNMILTEMAMPTLL